MGLPEIPLGNTVHGALLNATKATLLGLKLPALDDAARWFIRKQLWDIGLAKKTPCGIIATATKGIDWTRGETESEDIEYGVAIAFVAAGNLDLEAGMGCQLAWTEAATARLLNRRDLRELALPDGKEHIGTNIVAPSETFLQAASRAGWDAQYLIVRYMVRETRNTDDA